MPLLANLFKHKPGPERSHPLYSAVRDAMKDVQAYARSHGGEIQLVDISAEGLVKVRLRGSCHGCPMSDVTLKYGIERQLRELVPGVAGVTVVG